MLLQGFQLHFVSADLPSLACAVVAAQGRGAVLDLSGEQWLAQRAALLPELELELHTYRAVPYALGLWQQLEPRLADWLQLLELQALQPLLIPPLPGVDMLLRCLALAEALEQNADLTVLLPAPSEAMALLELARTGPALVETLLEPLLSWWDQTRQSLASFERVLRLRLPSAGSLRLDQRWRQRLEHMAALLAVDGPWQLSLALECADTQAELLRQRLSCLCMRGFMPNRLGLHGPAAGAVLADPPSWWPQQLPGVELSDPFSTDAASALLHREAVRLQSRFDAAAGMVRLPLPGVTKAELDVQQCGTTLVLIVGGQRKLVSLPDGLQERQCSGARLEQGWLELRFV